MILLYCVRLYVKWNKFPWRSIAFAFIINWISFLFFFSTATKMFPSLLLNVNVLALLFESVQHETICTRQKNWQPINSQLDNCDMINTSVKIKCLWLYCFAYTLQSIVFFGTYIKKKRNVIYVEWISSAIFDSSEISNHFDALEIFSAFIALAVFLFSQMNYCLSFVLHFIWHMLYIQMICFNQKSPTVISCYFCYAWSI